MSRLSRAIVVCVTAAAVAASIAVPTPSAQSRKSGPSSKAPAPSAKAPAPAPAPAVARTERPVPFKPGETLGYDISWSSYLTAGTATVSVKEKKPSYGSTAYYIVAEGRPTGLVSKLYTLYYKIDTLLDAYDLLPQRGSLYSEEGKRRRTKVLRFTGQKAEYEYTTSTSTKQDIPLPPHAQDALSAIYVLRAIPLQLGGKMTMPVVDSGKIYKVTLVVGGKELVKTGVGTLNAWKITPTIVSAGSDSPGRGFAVWVSDDERRLPLKIEAQLAVGSFNITLREVTGG